MPPPLQSGQVCGDSVAVRDCHNLAAVEAARRHDEVTQLLSQERPEPDCRQGHSHVEFSHYQIIGFLQDFLSGGTRIRTGDTMIFSHMQKPLQRCALVLSPRFGRGPISSP